jgi:curved DNA-binding protein CbpA
MNHYDTLGVAPDATPDEIKQAKRRAAKRAHPDMGGSDEQMAAVNRAYEVLSDPETRSHYDQTGEDPRSPSDPATSTLAELFEMAIDDCDGDVLAYCDRKITSALKELDAREDAAKGSIRKLNKKRDRVKAKGDGENLYTALIDRKLAVEQDLLRQVAAARKTMNGARERLRGYESTYVPETNPMRAAEQRMKSINPDDLIRRMAQDFQFYGGFRGSRPW